MTQQFSLKMVNSQFFTYREFLQSKFLVPICDMWISSFSNGYDENKHDDLRYILQKSGIREGVIVQVYLTPGKRKVIGVSCYMVGSEKLWQEDSNMIRAIKEKGVTVNDAYLYNLCIDPSKRRKGYGRKMIGEGKAKMEELGCKKIILFVDGDNPAAISLYNTSGFQVKKAAPTGFLMETSLIR